MIINIDSRGLWPANALSNFAPHAFVFQDVEIASMEGFLQALKVNDPIKQAELVKLVGYKAQKQGQAFNSWKETQLLWWKGVAYDRISLPYLELLGAAYEAMTTQSESFCKALVATQGYDLVHRAGKADPTDTVLTETEFINILYALRQNLISITDSIRAIQASAAAIDKALFKQ